jgi:hypothetical protein
MVRREKPFQAYNTQHALHPVIQAYQFQVAASFPASSDCFVQHDVTLSLRPYGLRGDLQISRTKQINPPLQH